jgi:biopolymer transport protein TolQ
LEGLLRLLGMYVLALQVQGAAGSDTSGGQDVIALVARSSPVAKLVLLVLILFSITSWGIILFKLWALNRAERQSASFLDVFRRSSKFSEVHAVCKNLSESPLVGIFSAGYTELNTQLRQTSPPTPAATPAVAPRTTLKSLPALDRVLLRAAAVEVNKLEHRIAFLATTASITPYIGLFGTVWGIMGAFQGIGQSGSTNIAVVAPHIAEALIATAAGLFAAIPAVYFYNHLASRVRLLASEMDDFSLEFLNISERNFT